MGHKRDREQKVLAKNFRESVKRQRYAPCESPEELEQIYEGTWDAREHEKFERCQWCVDNGISEKEERLFREMCHWEDVLHGVIFGLALLVALLLYLLLF